MACSSEDMAPSRAARILAPALLLGALACSSEVLGDGRAAGAGGAPPAATTSGAGGDGTVTGSGVGAASASGSGGSGAGGEAATGSGGARADSPCGLGPVVEDEPTRECLCHNCCEEAKACTKDGADPDGCVACLESGGGDRCDPLAACSDESCCGCGLLPMVCESGFVTPNEGADLGCLGQACCEAFTACAEGGREAEACRACIDEGGGPRCDAALACALEACGHVASELGTCRRR